MRRLNTIIKKEFIHIWRDKATLIMVLLMPCGILLLLGYAMSNDIEHLPLAVADLSKTKESRRYIDHYWVSKYFDIYQYVDGEDEILELIDRGEAKGGLLIPEDFGRKVESAETAAVQFYIDGTNPLEGQVSQLAVSTISSKSSERILISQLNRTMGNALGSEAIKMPIDAHALYMYNPNMRRVNYMVPGLIAVILQTQALLLTALSIVKEREQGTMEQLIVTPIKSWELMLGKVIPYVAVAFFNAILALAVGVYWFKVAIAGSILQLLLYSLIYIIGSLGMGVLVSAVSKTQMQAMYLTGVVIMMPSFILSGLMWPRESMPPAVYTIGEILPVTHYLVIVRGIMLKGVGGIYLWHSIWPMVALCLIFFIGSVLAFKKRIV